MIGFRKAILHRRDCVTILEFFLRSLDGRIGYTLESGGFNDGVWRWRHGFI
jgi:hypothetical protein